MHVPAEGLAFLQRASRQWVRRRSPRSTTTTSASRRRKRRRRRRSFSWLSHRASQARSRGLRKTTRIRVRSGIESCLRRRSSINSLHPSRRAVAEERSGWLSLWRRSRRPPGPGLPQLHRALLPLQAQRAGGFEDLDGSSGPLGAPEQRLAVAATRLIPVGTPPRSVSPDGSTVRSALGGSVASSYTRR